MEGRMIIRYDEEGDYFELGLENSSPTYGEGIDDEVTLFRREDDDEIVGIGILNFKERASSIDSLNLKLPFKISFSTQNL